MKGEEHNCLMSNFRPTFGFPQKCGLQFIGSLRISLCFFSAGLCLVLEKSEAILSNQRNSTYM